MASGKEREPESCRARGEIKSGVIKPKKKERKKITSEEGVKYWVQRTRDVQGKIRCRGGDRDRENDGNATTREQVVLWIMKGVFVPVPGLCKSLTVTGQEDVLGGRGAS